jgi:DNA-binding response OmpR family regulator
MSLNKNKLFCVDDDPISSLMLESIFADDYEIETFTTAEACLARLDIAQPDIFILNVGLPGIDGYELCRRIKSQPATQALPVLFISRNEDPEARLKGYEAGGEEFILKPYAIDEVRHRVQAARRALEQASAYREQLAGSEELSSLLLSNMDEYAVLIKFMRALNEALDEESLATALLNMLENYRLHGAVQIRSPASKFTLSKQGRNRPLEVSIIEHIASIDRIVSFRQRSAYNFEFLTLLVNDMPISDSDLCGRLRDHLAIASEMADAKIRAQIAERRFHSTQNSVAALLPEIQKIISDSIAQSEDAHREAAYKVGGLLEHLEFSFTPLGMSDELEEEIIQMVRAQAREILAVFDHGDASNAPLKSLESRMRSILAV